MTPPANAPGSYRADQKEGEWHLFELDGARRSAHWEEGILDDTIIMFTSDHGDMMGSHNVWNKMLFYEGSAKIPMVFP